MPGKIYLPAEDSHSMASDQNNSGLMSSAGLVRYFEQQSELSVTVDYRTVLAISILVGLIVQFASIAVAV